MCLFLESRARIIGSWYIFQDRWLRQWIVSGDLPADSWPVKPKSFFEHAEERRRGYKVRLKATVAIPTMIAVKNARKVESPALLLCSSSTEAEVYCETILRWVSFGSLSPYQDVRRLRQSSQHSPIAQRQREWSLWDLADTSLSALALTTIDLHLHP